VPRRSPTPQPIVASFERDGHQLPSAKLPTNLLIGLFDDGVAVAGYFV
jgi:hypothetical protein